MKHLDLFSGIGGFALAANRVWGDDYVNVGFCDNEPFAQAILRKHWPNAKIYEDIKELRGGGIGTVDLVTGGFPCQPFSAAGKRRGKEDDRHLWPEMLRVIRETSPRWVIGENVGGLLTWNGGMVLDEVYADLEAEGYEVWAYVIPACAVGAPHRRDRVWIVAHANRGADGGGTRKDARSGRARRIQKRNQVGLTSEPDKARLFTNPSSERSRRSTSEECGVQKRKLEPDQQERSEVRGESERCTSERTFTNNNLRQSNARNVAKPRKQKELECSTDNRGNGEASTDSNNHRWERENPLLKGGYGSTGNGGGLDWGENWTEVAALLCTLDDGLPNGLVRPKGWRNAALKAAGNAIVPQVAEMIMRGIKEIDA